jgi:hypothetical protein
MIGGLVATAVLSVIIVIESAMELTPKLDVISMLSGMMGGGPTLGWMAHLLIGVVIWGGLFSVLEPQLAGSSLWLKGVILGAGAWLLVMILVMPMADTDILGMQLGMVAPIMTLLLHVIYGAVLGGEYAVFQLPRHSQQLAHW